MSNDTGTIYSRATIVGQTAWSAWSKSWNTSNFDPGSKQAALGYTPVQQGTGIGQSSGAIVKIGYRPDTADVGLQIDAVNYGKIWNESNLNPALYQLLLGFTPVQQGTGTGQSPGAVIKIGYRAATVDVGLQVDGSDYGALWVDTNGIGKVAWATSTFGAGTVGSYGLFRANGGATTPGGWTAGGNLFFTDAGAQSSHGSPAGTWQLMGGLQNADNTDDDSASLFLRVA